MPIEGTVRSANVTVVLKHAENADQRAFDAGEKAFQRGLLYAVGVSQREFLQGPRPSRLGEVTTRLRQSITSKVTRTANSVRGQMGTNVKYGAYHEFGYHGTVTVRPFTRVMKQIAVDRRAGGVHWGVEVDTRRTKTGAIRKESRKRAAGRQTSGYVAVQFVKGHTRRVDYAGRPFVRPALEKAGPVILKEIVEALKAG